MDAEALVADAFLQLGAAARPPIGRPDGRVDLVVDPGEAAVPVVLKRRSLVSEDVAAQLLAAYGAPVAVRADQALDFFVPDQLVLRRATTLLGAAATPTWAGPSVRVAPVAAVCARRFDLSGRRWRWPLAHPLFVALDLAQDEGRGREILGAWNPDPRWARAW